MTTPCESVPTQAEIAQFVVRTLAELTDADGDLAHDVAWLESRADSLTLFEVVGAAEHQYGIEIPNEDLSGARTIEALVQCIAMRISYSRAVAAP